MKPKILITGGSGLLAFNWAAAVKEIYEVTLGLHLRRISLDGVSCQQISLDSAEAAAQTIKQSNASLVIHTAAMTNVDYCETEPELAYHANVEVALNVATACAEQGKKLVHISTDHVFSGESSMLDESTPVDPVNVYAQTKAEGEAAVLRVCPSAIVARTNFFGWGPPYRQSFSDRVLASLRGGKNIGLFRDSYFTPILMELLVKVSHELIERNEYGLFHIVGDERISKYEFGLRIAQTFGLDQNLIEPNLLAERQDLARRPLDLSLNNEKMRMRIGHGTGDVNFQLSLMAERYNRSNLRAHPGYF